MNGDMLGRFETIGAEVFGQSSALAQIAILLFVISIILLLLSLVSFQLSRVRQREEDRRFTNKGNVQVNTAPRSRPVVRVSWGRVEDDVLKGASDITADVAQAPQETLPEELHEETPAAFPQESEVSSGKVIGEMPVNVTYLNRNSVNTSGSLQARSGTDLSGQRIGPLIFHSSKPDTPQDTPDRTDAGQMEDNLDGFIFNQRKRVQPVDASHPALSNDPVGDVAVAGANSLSSAASPPDTMDEDALAHLDKIEDLMKELKRTYQAGQISSDAYSAQSRKLYQEAQQLMAKR